MRVKLKKHKRSRAGFSLAETLIAILILLMVSAIVAGAIPTASNVYAKTVDAANAQVLLSTVITALRDELSTASTITSAAGTTIEYVSGNDGYHKIELSTDADEPGIRLYYKGTVDESNGKVTYEYSRLLVSSKAATKNLAVKFDSVSYSNGIVMFSELRVERGGATLASRENLRIRTIR